MGLVESWRLEETGPPGGWDFSALEGRVSEPPLPWDFDAVTREQVSRAKSVLDMGTGGGERLLEFRRVLPGDTVATEGWEPNIPIARAALAPYGIEVVAFGQPDGEDAAPEPMPFADGRFEVVLNRHESYHPVEVARVLKPGGVFLTQQVGGDEFAEIREVFGIQPEAAHVQYANFRSALGDAGLDVVNGAEHVDHYTIVDVAALVAYLQLCPWYAPEDFSVDRYTDTLLELHERAGGKPLLVTRKRFWLMARKPG